MSIAIKVENLSKSYSIKHQQGNQYETLRDVITNKVLSFFKRCVFLKNSNSDGAMETEEFWALKNVSFEIEKGEKIGIIGRNGAGKSTLLKLLSRITEPTNGKVSYNGRMASLLEVGTGFHPELTGRENIFLNAAILGMSRSETRNKFKEIVEFAEIEKFLDTPVKRFSSGMYVRLAFSIAAHLNPDILIIDEVLAVGDTVFQKKCIKKINEISDSGATVLFVSHNAGIVRALCNKALYLENGDLKEYGDVDIVLAKYMKNTEAEIGCEYINNETISEEVKAGVIEASVLNHNNEASHSLFIDQTNAIRLKWQLNIDVDYMRIGIEVMDAAGETVLVSMDTDNGEWLNKPRKKGVYTEVMKISAFTLRPGMYSVKVFAGIPKVERLMAMDYLLTFNVLDNDTHFSHVPGENRLGYIAKTMDWDIQYVANQ